MGAIFDLHEELNIDCKTGCDKRKRQEITDDGICLILKSATDGLPVRCVGPWAKQKIYLLSRYFEICAKGMKGKWAGHVNYIEICCGPGRCINRKSGYEFDGTALRIINNDSFQYLERSLFFDIDDTVIDALNTRFTAMGVTKATAHKGDYYNSSELCEIIRRNIDPRGLNIVFIDPTDCSVPFSLIKNITRILPNTDFIINVASHTDFNRNVGPALLNPVSYQEVRRKYEGFLDNDNTFFNDPTNIQLAKLRIFPLLRKKFRELYVRKFNNIGYNFYDFYAIHHYYDLLFVTRDPRGLEFWRKAKSRGPLGEITLDLDHGTF